MQTEITFDDAALLDDFAVEELEVRLEMSHGICYHFPCLQWSTDWLGHTSCAQRSNFADNFYPLTGTVPSRGCPAGDGWVWAALPH